LEVLVQVLGGGTRAEVRFEADENIFERPEKHGLYAEMTVRRPKQRPYRIITYLFRIRNSGCFLWARFSGRRHRNDRNPNIRCEVVRMSLSVSVVCCVVAVVLRF
jgi:hypothetical protein